MEILVPLCVIGLVGGLLGGCLVSWTVISDMSNANLSRIKAVSLETVSATMVGAAVGAVVALIGNAMFADNIVGVGEKLTALSYGLGSLVGAGSGAFSAFMTMYAARNYQHDAEQCANESTAADASQTSAADATKTDLQ